MTEAEEYAAVEALMEEDVRLGYMEHVGIGEDGQPVYRLTDAGRRMVEQLPGGTLNETAGDS